MMTNSTASEWINTDIEAVIADIERLGLDDAVEYNMGLIADRQAAGDERWDSITADDLRAELLGMMKTDLTPKQAAFLEKLPIGEEVHIATSEYSTSPIPSTGWKPRDRFSAQGLKSLIAKGYLEGETYWRGATVKRIK